LKKINLILNWHSIAGDSLEQLKDLSGLYSITQTAFEKQIDYLLQNNIPIIPCHLHGNSETLPDFSVSLTFDDGNRSDYDFVYPFLKSKKISATFFIPVNTSKLSSQELKEMNKDGFEIGSHAFSHKALRRSNCEDEMSISKKILEAELHTTIFSFAFPYGSYTKYTISKAVHTGYHRIFSTERVWNDLTKENRLLHRWSVTSDTTLGDFEKIIQKASRGERLQKGIKLSRVMKRILGNQLSNKLNLFLHKKHF